MSASEISKMILEMDEKRLLLISRLALAVLALIIAILFLFSPRLAYTAPQQAVLFLLIAAIPAILFGAETKAQFEMKFPGFVFTTAGATAVLLGIMVLLHFLASANSDPRFAVYTVVRDQEEFELDPIVHKVRITPSSSHSSKGVEHWVDGNTLVVLFHDAPTATLEICKDSYCKEKYSGSIDYSLPQRELVLVDDGLKIEAK